MRVSVIIPAYNEEGVIGDCLKSLEKQNINNFEVVVVDDGSTDKTWQVLSELRIKSYELGIVKQKHGGAGAARNYGAKKARGEILVFVDADMTFQKNFLRKLVAPIVSGKAEATYTTEEEVGNWRNVWARCWNYNEGIGGKRRQRSVKERGIRWWYDRLVFVISERDFSRKKFEEERFRSVRGVLRAVKRRHFEKVGGYTPGGYTDDYSLGEKLGLAGVEAAGAKIYHSNPESLGEVFRQARWAGKRRYKLGWLGFGVAITRVFLPVTITVGIFKAVRFQTAAFMIFKVVYNTGITMGIISYYLFKRGIK